MLIQTHIHYVYFQLTICMLLICIFFAKFAVFRVFHGEIQNNNEVDYINNRIETFVRMLKTEKNKNKCVSVSIPNLPAGLFGA